MNKRSREISRRLLRTKQLPLQVGIASGEAIRDKIYLIVLVSIVLTAVVEPLIDKGLLNWFFATRLGTRTALEEPNGG